MRLLRPVLTLMAGLSWPAADNGARPLADSLVEAARHTKVEDIDYLDQRCDAGTTVEVWLKRLTAAAARKIVWTGGQCVTAIPFNPGIDAASWPWCAHAAITLTKPKARGDRPVIEVYFEKPEHGRPGKAYAFRSIMMTRDDGPDYERERRYFEGNWHERFGRGPEEPNCEGDP